MMKIRRRQLKIILVLFIVFPALFIGCSPGGDSGGDASGSSSSPSIKVTPSGYSFGDVTPDNSPAALEVEVANTGSSGLTVNEINLETINGAVLTDTFYMYLDRGVNPFHALPTTIAAGGRRTLEITFVPEEEGSFDSTLAIHSDDPDIPILDVPLDGSRAPITALNVRINQVEACPRDNPIGVYVSVTDQAGYPVTDLIAGNFSISETFGGNSPVDLGAPGSAIIPINREDSEPISVMLVMDYSGSITDIADAVQDMEDSVKSFIDQMWGDDEIGIIKFDNEVEVVKAFTSDQEELKAAVEAPWDSGRSTALYDALWQGVQYVNENSSNARKAVIVVTDGTNNFDFSGEERDRDEAITPALENDVPVFAVGLGQINSVVLQSMAEETGGQDYESSTSDNLRTIYQQMSNVLYLDYYLLTYENSSIPTQPPVDLTIVVDGWVPQGQSEPLPPSEHTKTILGCP